MAEITGGIHHVNLSVSNLEASTHWYQDLFGLTELARLSDEDGAWSKVILRHYSGLLIGLTEHSRNDSEPFAEWRCGVDHIALAVDTVDELEEWQARLQSLGIPASEIKTTPLGSLVTIRDPDNIQLELYAPKA